MRLWALLGGIVPLSCLLLACLPLSIMKTFLLMAGVQEAKPILQYLMAALQILCSPRSAVKPLFFLPSSKHAFNQLLDLVLKSGFRDLLMKATKKHIPSQALRRPNAVDVVYKASYCSTHAHTPPSEVDRVKWCSIALMTHEMFVPSWIYMLQSRPKTTNYSRWMNIVVCQPECWLQKVLISAMTSSVSGLRICFYCRIFKTSTCWRPVNYMNIITVRYISYKLNRKT